MTTARSWSTSRPRLARWGSGWWSAWKTKSRPRPRADAPGGKPQCLGLDVPALADTLGFDLMPFIGCSSSHPSQIPSGFFSRLGRARLHPDSQALMTGPQSRVHRLVALAALIALALAGPEGASAQMSFKTWRCAGPGRLRQRRQGGSGGVAPRRWRVVSRTVDDELHDGRVVPVGRER